MDDDETAEILNEFLVESYEGLDQLDLDLMEIESRGTDAELIGRVFRCVHTIKGTCGFLGLGKLESVTHVGETLLSRIRDGVVPVTSEVASALLALVDAIRAILRSIEIDGSEGDEDFPGLRSDLTRLADAPQTTPEPAASAEAGNADGDSPPSTEPDPSSVDLLGEILVQLGVEEADVAAALNEQRHSSGARVGDILISRGVATPEKLTEALEMQQDARQGSISDASIRVDVSLLDRLMNLVGELVLARNQILQCTSAGADATLFSTTQRLDLITSELQEGVMKTRMQPIGNVLSKFPRVVRDLALTCGKQASITMEGAETELDKTILEAIKDPLTHIVRNSVDHGLETPEVRVRLGKMPEGRVLLRAFHEGGQVNIEITDDGAGIDPARLRAKAVEKGVLTPEAAQRLSDRESLNLIFAAGFSTATKVTNVSGRGVGMDVVRTNIERIGGTVDVSSMLGESTTLRIKIPLTLAIIPGLVVTSGGERFAIPQVSLLELVRMERDEARKRIEMVHGTPVYRLRGTLLPLVHLNHALDLDRTPWPADTDAPDVPLNIAVLLTDGVPFGLVVDEINDTEEIVVKPLGKLLKGVSAFAGATIMGDGHIALILDVGGLAQMSRVLSTDRDRSLGSAVVEEARRSARKETLLVFGLGERHRMALPLSDIERLEEFSPTLVEHSGMREVVQYRGQVMQLIRLSQTIEGVVRSDPSESLLQVIVYSHEGRCVGLVVDRIVDIVETEVSGELDECGPMIRGTTVIHDRVTDILDLRQVMRSFEHRANPEVLHV